MIKTKVQKIYYVNIAIFLFLLSVIFFMFNLIDNESSQILRHKTTITKQIYNIKYKTTEAHLWFMEFQNGEKKEKNKIGSAFKSAEDSFSNLISIENSLEDSHHSKHRNSKDILNTIYELQKNFLQIKRETTYFVLDSKNYPFDDEFYDIKYNEFMKSVKHFEKHLDNIFENVLNDFEHFKHKVYLMMILLVIFTISFIVYLERRERKNLDLLIKQDKLIEKQYKLAAMGEMIDAIAHQWKQPLNIISMSLMRIELSSDYTKENFDECSQSIELQLKHLVSTLDEFRAFFRPKINLEEIPVETIMDSALLLVKNEVAKHNITIETNYKDNFPLKVNKNEFIHTIINIIQNSRDAFEQNNVENRKISITTFEQNNQKIIKISDNGGGIPQDVIKNIFTAHFTTKDENKGTGIGLYLTKQIIEKYQGHIEVKNENEGVSFSLIFDKRF